jgi:DivIVA domain-containing protein
MQGDEARSVVFQPRPWGYDPDEVEDFLSFVADELDAGRNVSQLNPTFSTNSGKAQYDVDAVDWFVARLRIDSTSLGGVPGEPWSSPMANYATWPVAEDPPHSHGQLAGWLVRHYDEEWTRFPDLQGAHLQWAATRLGNRELSTSDGEVIAIVSQHFGRAGPYGVLRVETQSDRYDLRHLGKRKDCRCELIDTSGRPKFTLTGYNFLWRAKAEISDWSSAGATLRFPARGSRRSNAVMTATDLPSGQRLAKFRSQLRPVGVTALLTPPIDVVVHPAVELSPQVVLMIAMTAPFVRTFFDTPIAWMGTPGPTGTPS